MVQVRSDGRIELLDREEGLLVLDVSAPRYLGIPGVEFVRRWDTGEFAADPDRPEVMRIAMLLPLAR